MKNKWLIILLVVSFIKGLIWLFFTPTFQIPDEPSHFSYVQFLAENNRVPHPRREVVTSKELFSVSQIVNFNWRIEHPVWQGYPENWLEKIKSINPEAKKEFIANPYLTSFKRPGLYYSTASLIYRLLANQSFLWQFFSVRFFSLLCQLIIIWLTFKICQKLFKKPGLSLAGAAAVSFHPAFSFILSGVSYEALGVLVVSLFLYLAVNKRKIVWLLLTALAGILIKPDLIFLWLLLPFCLPKKPRIIIIGTLVLSFIGFIWLNPVINQVIRGQYSWLDRYLYILPLKDYADYANQLIQLLSNKQILHKTLEYFQIFIQVHYHQIFAWYWGVFGWLEKTLPPLVYSVLKLLCLLSLIGLVKAKKIKFLILTVILQALIIIANDWLVFINSGQIYGIQGRYFLPAIAPQMILFTYGLSRFISPKLLIAGAVLLNLIGLFALFQYFGNVWF
jgi:hypothetical protein